MGDFIIKLGEDEYLLWSNVVDAPISFILTASELREQYIERRRDDAVREAGESFDRGLDLANAWGHSNRVYGGCSVEEVVAENRAGNKGKSLSLAAIRRKYRKPKGD